MFTKIDVMQMANAMATHAGARQEVVSQNVANADTPGYEARDLEGFAETYAAQEDGLRASRPGHLGAAGGALEVRSRTERHGASPNGNTVSLEDEMVRAVDIRRQHDMALTVYRSSLDLLRTSLGK